MLAKLVDGDDLSQSHDLVGTLRFMAPERFRGVTDRRGDIYALGATLYELLTLLPVFAERDQVQLIDQIVHHCLEKDRSNRFQSARDIAFSLTEQSDETARPTAPAPSRQRGVRRCASRSDRDRGSRGSSLR